MVVTRVVQGYWTEHSERAVLPTGLAVIKLPREIRISWVAGNPKSPTLMPDFMGKLWASPFH